MSAHPAAMLDTHLPDAIREVQHLLKRSRALRGEFRQTSSPDWVRRLKDELIVADEALFQAVDEIDKNGGLAVLIFLAGSLQEAVA